MCRSIGLTLVTTTVLAAGCAAEKTEEPVPQLENGSFFADLDGVRIHYEIHGSGPPVMTVPNSWGLNLDGLRALYRPLEERVTMVYFDPRGMGASDDARDEADLGLEAVRHDFDALRRHLGMDAVHAIGWSNGAINLILLASEYPDTLHSAMFVHGLASMTQKDAARMQASHPELTAKWVAFMQEMESPDLTDAERTERMTALWLDEWFPVMMADREGAREKIRETFAGAEFSWTHARHSQDELPTFNFIAKLRGLPVRGLVVAGAHDMIPPEKAEEMHAALPDSTYVLFENSGHFAPIEEPERFRSVVYDFLDVER